VSVAAAILLTMAAVGLLYAVAALALTVPAVDTIDRRARASGSTAAEIDDFVALVWWGAGIGLVVAVLVGALLVALAVGLRRGSQPARVTTWVVGGLGLFCGCAATGTTWIQRTVPMELPGVGFGAAVNAAYPGWWFPLNGALAGAQILGYLVVMVLLAAGSQDWFRRPDPLPPGYPWPGAGPAATFPPASFPPPAPPPAAPHTPQRPAPAAPPPAAPHTPQRPAPDDRWAPPSS
jgi:hypothetical protein